MAMDATNRLSAIATKIGQLQHPGFYTRFNTRYIGPFKVLERRGEVAYQLELLAQLSDVHNVFHVSQLKKCLRVPKEQLPLEELNVKNDLTYILSVQ